MCCIAFLEVYSEILQKQSTPKKLEKNIREVKDCWFCDIAFFEEEGFIGKVRNPRQITGENYGATHTHSNLNVKQHSASFIPVVLNNMTNDDYHLFFDEIMNRKDHSVSFKVILECDR